MPLDKYIFTDPLKVTVERIAKGITIKMVRGFGFCGPQGFKIPPEKGFQAVLIEIDPFFSC
jgi:hypothetical protein